MKRARTHTVTVMGRKWHCRCLPDAEYRAAHGRDSEAITLKDGHRIEFNAQYLSVGTVRHELLHAYFWSMPLHSASLTAAQIEEVAASILDEHWDNIGKLSRDIYRRLRK